MPTTSSRALRPTAHRLTRQGAATLEALAEDGAYRSAQDIHAALVAAGTPVGLTTMYRHLQLLAEAGELTVVHTAGEALYRRCGVSEAHHHHVVMICHRCHRCVEVHDPLLLQAAHAAGRRSGFSDVDHTLEIHGTCDTCS